MLVQFVLGIAAIILPLILAFILPIVKDQTITDSKLAKSIEECETVFTNEPAYYPSVAL